MRPVNITRSRLHQQVASHLQKEIIEGRFKPGDRLPPERELCATYGVGRPAIREALLALESAGLIHIANGAPAMVAMPKASTILANAAPAILQMLSTPEGQHQLQDFRLFIEIGWARHAALHATDAQLESLKKALEANAAALGDRDQFIRTDVAFHYVFAEIMDNTVFITLHEAMSGWLYEQRKIALREPYDDTVGYTAHVRIYDAVAARNPDAAETAMHDHLRAGTKQFWTRYDNS